MSFVVTVLGSSGMFATVERACSGYLLELDGMRLWMDAGSGTWRNLVAHVDYATLDGVLLSHRHPDHTSDIFQADHAHQFGGPEPLGSIPLWAPNETIERVCAFAPDIGESFEMRPVAAGEDLDIGGATFSFVGMVHPAETVGMRVERDGAVLAYTADTGPSADLGSLAHDADVFICEATLQDCDDPWSGHMSASQAGGIAAAAGVGKLVLTHLPPNKDLDRSLEEARRESGEVLVELATDGRCIEVGI
ncbi:MBL fold metallo-hydrolase [soil metagenome]